MSETTERDDLRARARAARLAGRSIRPDRPATEVPSALRTPDGWERFAITPSAWRPNRVIRVFRAGNEVIEVIEVSGTDDTFGPLFEIRIPSCGFVYATDAASLLLGLRDLGVQDQFWREQLAGGPDAQPEAVTEATG